MAEDLRQDRALETAAEILAAARTAGVFAGAGLSAESGLPTFRDSGGLWEGHRVEDVATPEGFRRDPVLVWRFYAQRQVDQTRVEPNAGHHALAAMEDMFDDFLLITQNVDNLSERAGSRKLVKIHGDLMEIWCCRCHWKSVLDRPVSPDSLRTPDDLPRCPDCGSLARPGVVWFGEMLPPAAIERAISFTAVAEVLLTVGTSGLVSGGYGFTDYVRSHGGKVIEVNPNDTYLSDQADIQIRSGSATALPAILERLQVLRSRAPEV
ncbi:MAG: NAD-dependent deacylase [Armatimonadota bacterium]|nr:MAG: NAD-dependent deacylase [Armatimonadota bacterium]